jgi:CHAT domain-containing protein
MTDSIATLRRRASDDDKRLLDELSRARSRHAVLTIKGPGAEGIEKHNADLKVLEEQTEQLENQISRRSLEFRAQLTPVNLENVQKTVPHNAALVEFAVYRPINVRAAKKEDRFGKPRYVAYILRDKGDPSWVELGDAKGIDDKINAFRISLRNKRSQNVRRLAREVDSLVMQPVRRLLGRTRRVLISPDGALNLIPFAALVDEQNQYLVRRYSFTYLSSGRDILRLRTKVEGKTSKMVIADPDFGEMKSTVSAAARGNELDELYFSPLKATAEEARELKRLFTDAAVLTKGQATEAALKAADRPAILHIATHGFFLDDVTQVQAGDDKEKTRIVKIKRVGGGSKGDNNPANLINPLLRSGLALAGANSGISKDGNDGILTALEAAGLDLWGTKLVVLSACDTGVGKVVGGDGVYGLRRALILAGSESQMISLWPVSDTGTSRLMVGYYETLKNGAGRSEALRQVQLRMLGDPKHRHPFYWASFIQSGEWANLEGKR